MFETCTSFFLSEEANDAMFKRLTLLYKNPKFEIIIIFALLSSCFANIHNFQYFSVMLHRYIFCTGNDESSIKASVKPSVFERFKDNLTNFFFRSEHHLNESKVIIELVTGSKLRKKLESGNIKKKEILCFSESFLNIC